MTVLTDTELLAWLERTSTGWRNLLLAYPEAATFPCSTRETQDIAGLLQHIMAVELRYAERLNDQPETPYEAIPFATEAIYAVHERAMALVRQLSKRGEPFWDEPIEFMTRSAGLLRATRRTVLVHLCMHGIRHYAQLATLVREHGVAPGWPMDYLFMAVG